MLTERSEFSFYVDNNGHRARTDFVAHWKGKPTKFGMCPGILQH
jgi:hypothetical protein